MLVDVLVDPHELLQTEIDVVLIEGLKVKRSGAEPCVEVVALLAGAFLRKANGLFYSLQCIFLIITSSLAFILTLYLFFRAVQIFAPYLSLLYAVRLRDKKRVQNVSDMW